MSSVLLKVSGEVDQPSEWTFEQLRDIGGEHQITDVSQYDVKRAGGAVKLAGLLGLVGAKPSASYLGLHSSADNFHASIPLEPVRDRAFLIYQVNDQPLDASAGGPLRFFVPDHAACHTDEIDECANVKFVDHIELTAEKGFDNRPEDEDEHEELHRKQSS